MAEWIGEWMHTALRSALPWPSTVLPSASTVIRLLAVISLHKRPWALTRKCSGRPRTLRLKWFQMPSSKPKRAASQCAAAKSIRASWAGFLTGDTALRVPAVLHR